ncbi:ArsR/SmtB family transcription factor [Paenibacillus pinihumi]|uniref:ArsR/SmtB family transcription factor n=1 Tax=Paenibacillus pinihumi TaxID=669462 RepID=UPI000416EBFF|nr:helix-turn-helix domain-containing protein [Paenibacillus pinihumi]
MKFLYHPDRAELNLSTVLYALSDPVRLLIVSKLSTGEERTCGDFGLPVVKSTVSHHVRTLRESGVVRVRVQGTQRFVSLRADDLNDRFPGLLAAILKAYNVSEEKQNLLSNGQQS